MKFTFCIYFVVQLISAIAFNFEEITREIFPLGEDNGIIAAFGHFNSDEYTDVVSLQQGGYKLQLLKGSENRPYFQTSLNCSFPDIITSVVPGDYNGDSQPDLLITFSKSNNDRNEVMILWGNNGSIDCKSDTILSLLNQPFVVDFDGDMIPDIIGDDIHDEKRHVWISSPDKKFKKQNLTNVSQRMRKTHSSGLIDLNNDLTPDFLITGEIYIESWINSGKDFVLDQTKIPYPHKIEWLWQSTFVDMNLDGKMNHIMPVCKDRKCHESEILIWNENQTKWEVLFSDFMNPHDQTVWGFKLPIGATLVMAALPVTLRAGDVDMDGYPDFITVLQSKKVASDVRAVIMRNRPCSNNCTSGRTLEIVWDVPVLKDIPNVQIAAFFDLFEDGILDILVSTNVKQEWKIHALKNTEIFDSCFLKVLVLGGLCNNNCSVDPYGTNQPGPVVRYNMTTQEGKALVSSSIQLSQSAHFPLQLPYSLFGLGPTPNFIDVLTVSINFNKSLHKREWVQIIPNSQIVIIPRPPDNERKWVKKLFVTPSHLVFLTCIALIGTCIFLCLLVALLHWVERREDKKERMQDAYRFHFDAM